MDDTTIVQLYWDRDERAIPATSGKYGNYCNSIAWNILGNREDAEECVNDTYLCAWTSMPPHRPRVLSAFLGKLTRNLSLNRYKHHTAEKRGGGEAPDADQGVGGDFPYPYRNETDRDTSGSRQNRGYRSLRTQIMLFDFYHEFYFGVDLSRPLSGYFAESSEAGRTVRETEMLSEL